MNSSADRPYVLQYLFASSNSDFEDQAPKMGSWSSLISDSYVIT